MSPINFQQLYADIIVWFQTGHDAIMWLSGITGLSSGFILCLLLGMGKSIAQFVIKLVKLVLLVAVILFVANWYIASGFPMPNLTDLGLPTLGELNQYGPVTPITG